MQHKTKQTGQPKDTQLLVAHLLYTREEKYLRLTLDAKLSSNSAKLGKWV